VPRCLHDDNLSRFHRTPSCDGRIDRRTDGRTDTGPYQYRASIASSIAPHYNRFFRADSTDVEKVADGRERREATARIGKGKTGAEGEMGISRRRRRRSREESVVRQVAANYRATPC